MPPTISAVAAPAARRPASRSPRSGLPARLLAIAADELEHAFYETGRRILTLYLRDLAESEVMKLTRDPSQLRSLLDRILADDRAAASITAEGLRIQTTRYYPKPRTRDALTCLTDAVNSRADLSGIPLAECCDLIEQQLHFRLKPESLRAMLKRNGEYHTLAIRRERVKLQSDLIVQVLGARHQAQREATAREATGRKPKPKQELETAQKLKLKPKSVSTPTPTPTP